MTEQTHGYVDGERCNRECCEGTIQTHAPDNCSCHLSAPCSACTAPRGYCDTCTWEEAEEAECGIVDHIGRIQKSLSMVRSVFPDHARPLDSSRIDWRNRSHSNSSMIKEGVYPPHATRKQVEELVQGTFGGKFEYFGDGKFKYIAYTD